MFLLWILRFFVFTLYESPKYLMGRGRDAEAVEVLHKVARYNGMESSLKIEHLQAVDERFASDVSHGDVEAPGVVWTVLPVQLFEGSWRVSTEVM